MIELAYELNDSWKQEALTTDFSALTEFSLEAEVFRGAILFKIDDVDLSWYEDLPILDFARGLLGCALSLEVLSSIDYLSPDYPERFVFRRLGRGTVWVIAEHNWVSALCDLDELRSAAAYFIKETFSDFLALYPKSRLSADVLRWYPANEVDLCLAETAYRCRAKGALGEEGGGAN